MTEDDAADILLGKTVEGLWLPRIAQLLRQGDKVQQFTGYVPLMVDMGHTAIVVFKKGSVDWEQERS